MQKRILLTVFSLGCVVIINCAQPSQGIEREQDLSLENIDPPNFISFLLTYNTSSLTAQISTSSQLQSQNVKNNWLKQSFEEHSLAWLFATSIIGGIVGASTKLVFEIILPNRLRERRKILNLTQKYSTPILLSAEALRNRLANMIKFIELVERDKWLSQEQITYYYISTIYLVSRFFGWLEILRNTVVYLDMNSLKKPENLSSFLKLLRLAFPILNFCQLPLILSHEIT